MICSRLLLWKNAFLLVHASFVCQTHNRKVSQVEIIVHSLKIKSRDISKVNMSFFFHFCLTSLKSNLHMKKNLHVKNTLKTVAKMHKHGAHKIDVM